MKKLKHTTAKQNKESLKVPFSFQANHYRFDSRERHQLIDSRVEPDYIKPI